MRACVRACVYACLRACTCVRVSVRVKIARRQNIVISLVHDVSLVYQVFYDIQAERVAAMKLLLFTVGSHG